MKMKHLGLILLPFAALALLGDGCSFSGTVNGKPVSYQTGDVPVTHSDWQTFTGTGFSLQYPGDKVVDLLTDYATLPDAVGGKARRLLVAEWSNSDDQTKAPKLDANGCYVSDLQSSTKQVTVVGHPACLTTTDDPGAGNDVRSYYYAFATSSGHAIVELDIRHVIDVHVYAGCETDADLTKQTCIDYAFDEARDTQLFSDIMATVNISK